MCIRTVKLTTAFICVTSLGGKSEWRIVAQYRTHEETMRQRENVRNCHQNIEIAQDGQEFPFFLFGTNECSEEYNYFVVVVVVVVVVIIITIIIITIVVFDIVVVVIVVVVVITVVFWRAVGSNALRLTARCPSPLAEF